MNLIFKYGLLVFTFIGLIGMVKSTKKSLTNNVLEGTISSYKNTYQAGDEVVLKVSFKNQKHTTSINKTAYISLNSSYGSVVLSEYIKGDLIDIQIPSFLSKKSGVLSYTLHVENKELDSGKVEITPNSKQHLIAESYIGPPSIFAGGTDFTMAVFTPTDIYDNLLPNNSPVSIREQFQNNLSIQNIVTKNRIGWKRIYSPTKAGRIFTAATIKESATKEMSVEVFPAAPENFEIISKQIHPYADGHQIVTLETSLIRDAYNNIISDGTLVEFNCYTDQGGVIKTSATTINGIATAQFLHPFSPSKWTITGTIPGIATSPEHFVTFIAALEDFNVSFSNNNANVTIGPITSYLKQLVPDGTEVTLRIEDENLNFTTTKNGFAKFNLTTKGLKTISITVLGVSKTFSKEIK